MKGLELSEAYFRTHGLPMLERDFPGLLPHLAAGLLGSGSECFGYDDDLSTDHDFEPGFCLFLPSEEVVDRRTAFLLERAYAALPAEFMGYRRAPTPPVGGSRHGVLRLAEFLAERTGRPDGRAVGREWLCLPEQSLAEVTNGRVFYDGRGELTDIRRHLSYFPEDVRLKKLAGQLLLMGQSGLYNYGRSLVRGDTAAAQLSAIAFADSATSAIFLLNATYRPYYKWCFRTLMSLPLLGECAGELEYLISSGNTEREAEEKSALITRLAAAVVSVARGQGLTDYRGDEMEGHAAAVNRRVGDADLRTLPLLYGV